uniref:Capsule gland specific secretory protein n=1 Tax=Reishia bronni TaxID=578817 RepID=A0A6G9KPA5_9CAEN|nr:capsule gland specific secretory protein [Reishia bronni]
MKLLLFVTLIAALEPVTAVFDFDDKFDDPFEDFKFKDFKKPSFDPHKPSFPPHKPVFESFKFKFDPPKPKFDPHKPKFDPHKPDFDPHKPFDFSFPKFSVKKVEDPHKVDVHALQKTVDAIQSNQQSILSSLILIFKRQGGINNNLGLLLREQKGSIAALGGVISDARAARNNTSVALDNQQAILRGQAGIRKLVSGEHANTRHVIKRAENELVKQLGKVQDKQRVILRSLDRSEAVISAGFDKAQATERVTQGLVGQAQAAVAKAAAANARGQANITAQVRRSQKAVQADIAKIFGRQGAILARIAAIQKSEENKLDKVLGRQKDILAQIQASQKAVQGDVQVSRGIEKQTQGLIRESQRNVQKDLASHKANQAQTQHLAKKCVAAGKCDLSKIERAIVEFSKHKSDFEKRILKGLRAVLHEQEQTQGAVAGMEKAVVRTVNKEFDQLDQVIRAIENFFSAAKGKIQRHLKVIEQNIAQTKSSQSVALKLIAKIANVVHVLAKKLH